MPNGKCDLRQKNSGICGTSRADVAGACAKPRQARQGAGRLPCCGRDFVRLVDFFGICERVQGSVCREARCFALGAARLVRVAGQVVNPRSPRDAIEAGLALVPEDRKQQGLIIEWNVRQNTSLAALRSQSHAAGFLSFAAERADAATMIGKLRIKTPGDQQVIQYLSGGNQQKVVLGKWLALNPRVLLLDEPTRGIDIGAKQDIYALMEELAGQGVAVLFVSSEMEEILGMSDRTLVMHEGRLTGELSRDQLSEEAGFHLPLNRDGVLRVAFHRPPWWPHASQRRE